MLSGKVAKVAELLRSDRMAEDVEKSSVDLKGRAVDEKICSTPE